jgi:hypothetical protein
MVDLPPKPRDWRWVIPVGALVASAVTAWRTRPMAPVLDWLEGDTAWARVVMAFGLFLAVYSILILSAC